MKTLLLFLLFVTLTKSSPVPSSIDDYAANQLNTWNNSSIEQTSAIRRRRSALFLTATTVLPNETLTNFPTMLPNFSIINATVFTDNDTDATTMPPRSMLVVTATMVADYFVDTDMNMSGILSSDRFPPETSMNDTTTQRLSPDFAAMALVNATQQVVSNVSVPLPNEQSSNATQTNFFLKTITSQKPLNISSLNSTSALETQTNIPKLTTNSSAILTTEPAAQTLSTPSSTLLVTVQPNITQTTSKLSLNTTLATRKLQTIPILNNNNTRTTPLSVTTPPKTTSPTTPHLSTRSTQTASSPSSTTLLVTAQPETTTISPTQSTATTPIAVTQAETTVKSSPKHHKNQVTYIRTIPTVVPGATTAPTTLNPAASINPASNCNWNKGQ